MGNHGISFHFPETDASEPLSPFDRLLSERVDWTGCADLEFIVDHMSKTLIEYTANIHIRIKLRPQDSRVHGLVSVVIVPCPNELFTKVIRGYILFGKSNVSLTAKGYA